MQDLERMINIYHAAFIAFLVLAVVLFIASVVLFFKFNIRRIFDMKTGRGAKKTIQRMKELNAQTGKLRSDVISNTPVRLPPEERISAPVTEKRTDIPAVQPITEPAVSIQTDDGGLWDGSQKTELLSDMGLQQTALLHSYNETADLLTEQTERNPQPGKLNPPGVFRIERDLMWVHTEEVL